VKDGSSESINFNAFDDHIMKEESETLTTPNDDTLLALDNEETTTKKKRKPRSDKNKRRKFPNRAYNAYNSDQKELLCDKQGEESVIKTPTKPKYAPEKDYYKEFYKLYLQNENLIADIDEMAADYYKIERRILYILDFYDCTLVP